MKIEITAISTSLEQIISQNECCINLFEDYFTVKLDYICQLNDDSLGIPKTVRSYEFSTHKRETLLHVELFMLTDKDEGKFKLSLATYDFHTIQNIYYENFNEANEARRKLTDYMLGNIIS